MEDNLGIKKNTYSTRELINPVCDTLASEQAEHLPLPEWAKPEILNEMKQYYTFTFGKFYATKKLQRLGSGDLQIIK